MVFGFPPLVGRTRRKPPAEVRLGGAVRWLQAARCESGTIRGPWLGGSRGGDRPGKLPTMLLPTNAPATDRESFRRRLAVARQALICSPQWLKSLVFHFCALPSATSGSRRWAGCGTRASGASRVAQPAQRRLPAQQTARVNPPPFPLLKAGFSSAFPFPCPRRVLQPTPPCKGCGWLG